MISRRFLLGAAPAALVAHVLPSRMICQPEGTGTVAVTWGAGHDQLLADYIAQIQAGIIRVEDLRIMEGLPDLDVGGLLRCSP